VTLPNGPIAFKHRSIGEEGDQMIRSTAIRMCGAFLLCGVFLAACTSSSSSSSSTTSTSSSAPSSSSFSDTGSPVSPSGDDGSTSAIDGKWNGTWTANSNAGSGTFAVTFKQDGSSLNGTLSISVACLDGAKVTGKLNGSAIEFGSVKGECEVEYKGSVNGGQMSGTYSASGVPGGTWKASKA
jgi:hypothetical protein